ncbi:Non-hem dioxygenase N-terminal domain protein [Kalmanozyma brasiliensis GHG001]|uniref:Fe2OG dioxygenase domain-containing protein n=1 Tax=Kalmanozyma brasiliensis (strain GHG001) TaxID=1365824 RepID=V5EXI0_KALBG|nr:Non-hem dioxygenase N-terminal domain protein [Kalmanozyma brasiliensis GHG001]EST08208.1 Non-hem dioxygenase N-terminal domain protein [Kalmanozyma brasiliensis GHG001]
MASTTPISIISLRTDQDGPALGPRILDAVVKTGFFYLSDHGITQPEIDSLFRQSAQFFLHEPESERVKCQDRPNNTGYTSMRQERLDPTQAGGDLKESFYLAGLARTASGSSPAPPQYQPPSQLLPPSLAEHESSIAAFIEKCKSICDTVLAGFAEAIDLPSRYFVDSHHGQHDRLRLIHYPPAPVSTAASASMSIRAGSHSDYGSCTLLFQKDVGGLQVETQPGRWVDIPPQPGCIVVNVGDAMEFWSAGLFRSTQHRVVLPRVESETASRFSVAYFCQPDEDARLEALPISQSVREKCGGNLMDRSEFETRCRAKGVADVTGLTGGQHLQARLSAGYRPTRS